MDQKTQDPLNCKVRGGSRVDNKFSWKEKQVYFP